MTRGEKFLLGGIPTADSKLPRTRRRQRARKGYNRLIVAPSTLAYSRLEREAKRRTMAPGVLAARLLELLAAEPNLYAAVLDD